MSQRRAAGVVVLGLSLMACGPSDMPSPDEGSEAIGSASDAIVNGTVDNGNPAVVALISPFGFSCSGTLIRPNVVLTAAHCVPPHISDFGANSYDDMQVFFGTNVQAGGTVVDVIDGWTHPGWNIDTIEHDIALLRLAGPGPTAPIPFATEPFSGFDVGTTVEIVGFGRSSSQSQDYGVKQKASTQISEIYQYIFTMDISPAGTCNGDSGGTTLMATNDGTVVAGIHSRSDCQTQSIDTTVADYLDEIYAFIGEDPTATCNADGLCAGGCTAPDPDCPCAMDGHCTAACNDPNSDPDCVDACGADGTCNASCSDDPDCACIADGFCDTSCSNDPDCGGASSSSNSSSASSASGNPGWAGPSEQEYDGFIVESGGCATAREPRRSKARPWLILAGLGLFALRRRQSRRALRA